MVGVLSDLMLKKFRVGVINNLPKLSLFNSVINPISVGMIPVHALKTSMKSIGRLDKIQVERMGTTVTYMNRDRPYW